MLLLLLLCCLQALARGGVGLPLSLQLCAQAIALRQDLRGGSRYQGGGSGGIYIYIKVVLLQTYNRW